MKKLISKETVRLLFDLGIELLKTFKGIYETNKERTQDEDTSKNINRDNQKDSNSSNTANNH